MKKVLTLMMIALVVVVSAVASNAQEMSAQITVLEQKAERIQSQIDQAKQQGNMQLDQQVRTLKSSVDALVNQRVQLDSQITRLESQIDEIRNSAQSNLSKQVTQYNQELSGIKQQIQGLVMKKEADSAVKTNVATGPAVAAQSVAPATLEPKVESAAAGEKPCPNCPPGQPK
jgi:chromosome segregation ATPase